MTDPGGNGLNVAAELAGLRGEMAVGFARIEGAITALTQSLDRTSSDVDELDKRVSALEARRWPMTSMAAVSGVVSAAVAVAAMLIQM